MDLEKQLELTLNRHLTKNDGQTPPNLAEAIRYSLLAPGKRIRPRILLACAQMLGLQEGQALPAALALEMIHCFTLIHDDLPCMDDDDFRRGRPSCHKKFDEALALLAGDALIPLAIDVFMDSAVDPLRLLAGLKHFTWASGPRGVVGGQAAESLLKQDSPFEEMIQMHAQKTGALFSAALLVPMEFAGIAPESEKGQAIQNFAATLGLAFQAADDLEDATSESTNDPTHVLHYRKSNDVVNETVRNLTQVSHQLTQLWQDSAQPLTHIADEVIRKIEVAQK